MVGKKFLIMAMVLIAMIGTANAAITLTVNEPTANELFLPNMDSLEYIDVNITVVDSVATNSVHEISLQYYIGDANVFVISDSNSAKGGTDANLYDDQCKFFVSNVWTTPGADCIFRIPTKNITSGNYILDANVTTYGQAGEFSASTTSVRTFRVDNRWINASTEALIIVIPVVLIAALLVGIVLLGMGAIGGKTLLIIVVGAVVSIIAVVVLSGIMDVLTP